MVGWLFRIRKSNWYSPRVIPVYFDFIKTVDILDLLAHISSVCSSQAVHQLSSCMRNKRHVSGRLLFEEDSSASK